MFIYYTILLLIIVFSVAIEFERYLQMLEGENRLYEMGLAMKKANQEKSRDTVCSIEALV